MMKSSLSALFLSTALAAAQPALADQYLPMPHVDASGNVWFPGGPTIGKWIGGVWTTNAASSIFAPPGTGASSRSVQSRLSDNISVKDFGAHQDGVTDDSTAINNAIIYANSKGGGFVDFPGGGTYAISHPIVMQHGVTLRGHCAIPLDTSGALNCGKIMAVANMTAMITQPDLTQFMQTIGLDHIAVDGNKTSFTVANVVELSAVNSRIENSFVMNGTGTCVNWLRNATAAWINWIQANNISDCNGTGLLYAGTDSKIILNQFSNNGADVEFDSPGGLIFANNQVENARTWGLVIKDVHAVFPEAYVLVTGNEFIQNNGVGLGLPSAGDYGDLFITSDGLDPSALCGSIVSNNFFGSSAGTNVTVDSACKGGVITGNTYQYLGVANQPTNHIKFGSYPTVTTAGTYAAGTPFAVGGGIYNIASGATFALSGTGVPAGATATFSGGNLTASAAVTVTAGEVLTLQQAAGQQFTIGANAYGLPEATRFKNLPFDTVVAPGSGSGGPSAEHIQVPPLNNAFHYSLASSGSTIVIPDNQDTGFAFPAAAVAAITFQLPTCSAAYNGKRAWISTSQDITTATVTTTAGTVWGQPTNPMKASTGSSYFCVADFAGWFRQSGN